MQPAAVGGMHVKPSEQHIARWLVTIACARNLQFGLGEIFPTYIRG
jgi:hypothetical protein